MIAKVIVHAPTRREARRGSRACLKQHEIHGLTTNRDFLVATLRTPEFVAGDTTTDFIERVRPPPARVVPRGEQIDAAVVVAIEGQARRRAAATVASSLPSGWRNNPSVPQRADFGDDLVVEYVLSRSGEIASLRVGEPSSRPRACTALRPPRSTSRSPASAAATASAPAPAAPSTSTPTRASST